MSLATVLGRKIWYAGEVPDLDEYQLSDDVVIRPEDVPVGDSTEDRRERNRLIRQFYYQWLNRNDSRKVFNRSFNDYIHVKYFST